MLAKQRLDCWYIASVQLNTRYGTLVGSGSFCVEYTVKYDHHIYFLGIDTDGKQVAGKMGRVDDKGHVIFRPEHRGGM